MKIALIGASGFVGTAILNEAVSRGHHVTAIVRDAPAHLRPGGWLLLEHGWEQGEAVRALLRDAGFFDIATERDLEGRDRVTLGRLP